MIADAVLRVGYPGTIEPHEELLQAQHIGGDHFMLAQHSQFLPLGPGDVVTAADGLLTDVVSLAAVYVVDVFIDHHRADEEATQRFENWRRDVDVTQTSTLTARISTVTREWVDRTVVPDPAVFHIDLMRRPEQRSMNLAAEVEKY